MTTDEFETAVYQISKALNKQNQEHEVAVFQALILKRRGDKRPSKEDFLLSRTIANGIVWGWKMAEQNPDVHLHDLSEFAKALAQKGN